MLASWGHQWWQILKPIQLIFGNARIICGNPPGEDKMFFVTCNLRFFTTGNRCRYCDFIAKGRRKLSLTITSLIGLLIKQQTTCLLERVWLSVFYHQNNSKQPHYVTGQLRALQHCSALWNVNALRMRRESGVFFVFFIPAEVCY